MQKITPFLWFNTNAEQALKFYASVFKGSTLGNVTRYTAESAKVSGMPKGSVMTGSITIRGQTFHVINGGPVYQFTPAISFMIPCATQKEIDHFWLAFSKGGQPMPCGWITDKFGITWQVVPADLRKWIGGPDPAKSKRALHAMFQMKKMDIQKLKDAYAGK